MSNVDETPSDSSILTPNHTNSLADVLHPLNIGRVRDKKRMKPIPPQNRELGRPNSRQRARRPGEQVNENAVNQQGVRNTTTSPSVTDSLGKVTVRPSVGDGDEMGGKRHGVNDHATNNESFTCQPTSSQHSAYIKENLELLQKKCQEFQECTKEVYRAENFHRILSGGNIQLSNICGLMYPVDWKGYTTLNEQCSDTERAAIRQDIGSQLASNLAEPPQGDDASRRLWNRLRSCLSMNTQSGEKSIETACRLKKNSSQFLCDDSRVDQLTEEFFNHEMEHLHCSCKAISEEAANRTHSENPVPVPVRIGIAIGGLSLLIVLIIVVVVLFFRHRRVKRELDKHRMQYLPSPHGEASAIYQEIGEHSQAIDVLRRARDIGNLPGNYNFLGQAPNLPERYVKDISRSKSNLANLSEGDPEYLEPAPGCGKSFRLEAHINDAYNSSQGSSQRSGTSVYELAKPPGNSPPVERAHQVENETYFSPISLSRAEEEHGGYSKLSQKYAVVKKDRGEEVVSEEEKEPLTKPPSDAEDGDVGGSVVEPKYFVLESQKEAVKEREVMVASTIPV